jgi:hypothetical protein
MRDTRLNIRANDDPPLCKRAGTLLMRKYRVEAIIQGEGGNLEVLTAHRFEAPSTAEAERFVDDWVTAMRVVYPAAARLRIVRAEMIIAERRVSAPTWIRV